MIRTSVLFLLSVKALADVSPLGGASFPCQFTDIPLAKIRLALDVHNTPSCRQDSAQERREAIEKKHVLILEGIARTFDTGSAQLKGGEQGFLHDLQILLACSQAPVFWKGKDRGQEESVDETEFKAWRPYIRSFFSLIATSPHARRFIGSGELRHPLVSALQTEDFWKKRSLLAVTTPGAAELSEDHAWAELEKSATKVWGSPSRAHILGTWRELVFRTTHLYLRAWQSDSAKELFSVDPAGAESKKWIAHLETNYSLRSEQAKEKLFALISEERSLHLEEAIAEAFCDLRTTKTVVIARVGMAHAPTIWKLLQQRFRGSKTIPGTPLNSLDHLTLDARALAYDDVKEISTSVPGSEADKIYQDISVWSKSLETAGYLAKPETTR